MFLTSEQLSPCSDSQTQVPRTLWFFLFLRPWSPLFSISRRGKKQKLHLLFKKFLAQK